MLHDAIRVAADPMAVLDRIVQQCLDLVPAADGCSLEVRRGALALEYVSASGTLADFVGLQISLNASLSGLSVRTGQVQLCADALDDPRVDRAAVAATGVRSMLCVPLSQQRGGIAVLKVSSRQPGAFSAADADRLGVLARFLDVSVSAASDLARVTADVLTELDRMSHHGWDPEEAASARFVANVLTPGLAELVDARSDVQDVLDSGALDIYLQPVVELTTGGTVGWEALSRFPGENARPPTWWFAAAQAVGLGVELELLALRKALEHRDVPGPGQRLAVNVGPRTVLDPRFAAALDGPVDRITIELTEHEVVADYPAVVQALEEQRIRGAKLSVDDTGSGYSGLAHIMRMRPDVIKLDRELVSGIHLDPIKRAMATAVVTFAEAIGATVIAEGIEADEEAQALRSLYVTQCQGYLFGRPEPAPPRRSSES